MTPLWKLLLFAAAKLGLVIWGSDVTVDAATALAEQFGMSERFIGLTIVALGTSLPELVTSITAARRGKADIAIGNIVGSNIFNILFVVGTTALITPVVFAPQLPGGHRCGRPGRNPAAALRSQKKQLTVPPAF